MPPEDNYTRQLQQEYRHLAHKYNLAQSRMPRSQWNFLRLRPANFPPLRLAQLAAFLHRVPQLRNALLESASAANYHGCMQLTTSPYWQAHYQPGKPAGKKVPAFGADSVRSVLLNAVVPLLVCYGRHHADDRYQDKAIALLESVPSEHNRVVALYEALGQRSRFAADSQALVHLFRHYCEPVRCLACAIGVKILKG